MSDAASAQQTTPQNSGDQGANRVFELRVSGNLMRLETGVYCIINKPLPQTDLRSGLPGVRISPAPGVDSRPEQVEISCFSNDGWLSGFGDAAMVRVHQGPAHVMVTVYQNPSEPEQSPNIQVVRLLENAPPRTITSAAMAMAQGSPHVGGVPQGPADSGQVPASGPRVMDMVAHIQGLGDVGALIDDRLGEVGSKRWIEGFAIAPMNLIVPSDIEYQAVLGRGWLSPWVEGGEFCGSRGMALPVLGLKLRLRGNAARDYDCSYMATFTDGTQAGPVPAGTVCESESLAPLESFQILLRPRGQAAAPSAAPASAPEPVPASAAPAPAAPAAVAEAKAPSPKPKAVPKAPAAPAAKAAPTKPAAKPPAKPAPRRR